ncbi:hypothetical protein [Streptomyces sp. NBC_01506]|uniref:hypothetical protein n=1 Tax=Streptomyces sp. NBC_01506 TaxID=2903887 RepID=UPI00386A78D9
MTQHVNLAKSTDPHAPLRKAMDQARASARAVLEGPAYRSAGQSFQRIAEGLRPRA